MNNKKHYIALFSLHGLVRGENIELGRDADTGGQIKYVVELARELGKQSHVARVDLLTRQVIDGKVSKDYTLPTEQISEKAHIIRLPCGPKRYLRKEVLWNYLESFIDQSLQYFRQIGQTPDIIHGHYAEAGYVGTTLAKLLEVPVIFTGHSLGLVKKARLLEKGLFEEQINEKYNINYRIEAEERALNAASMVITSTHQEIHDHYEKYQYYKPDKMVVIPPGVDLECFYPVKESKPHPDIEEKLSRFITHPKKQIILARSCADQRNNLPALIKAYGENPELQELANLIILAGNRDDMATMDRKTRQVLNQVLLAIDRYDLYGKVAYPKRHESNEIPEFYRHTAARLGIFVNPALTEPFGITLIEAAATGLPIVTTHNGGSKEIIKNCQNGLLIDPLNTKEMGKALVSALLEKKRWKQWSQNGIEGVKRHYSWTGHVQKYLNHVDKLITETPTTAQKRPKSLPGRENFGATQLPLTKHFIISDIDDTLIGDRKALDEFLTYVNKTGRDFSFGIATGRQLDYAINVLDEWKVPPPDVLITAVGTEIYYGPNLLKDTGWKKHINYRWEPERLKTVLSIGHGLELQPKEQQSQFKVSYFITETFDKQKSVRSQIAKRLREEHLLANIIAHNNSLDILPIRASKGLAIRYLAYRWGLPLKNFLVAGDSGNDEEMLKDETLAVVVGNYSPELDKLKGRENIFFAKAHYANGIIEGIKHFGLFNEPLADEPLNEPSARTVTEEVASPVQPERRDTVAITDEIGNKPNTM